MKIHVKDYRVPQGKHVDLKEWPTNVDPVYESKKQYKKLLECLLRPLHREPKNYVTRAPHGTGQRGGRDIVTPSLVQWGTARILSSLGCYT